jgi:hypothetical protein
MGISKRVVKYSAAIAAVIAVAVVASRMASMNSPLVANPVQANSAAIGSSASMQGTTIGILGLVEDSRCPVDVQCIQAGTVRVRTSVDALNRDFVFTLGQPQVVGSTTITLASVTPAQRYSKQTVEPGDYRFSFTAVPAAAGAGSSESGIRGTVALGPTCPVERVPPDPRCADRPYAAPIAVYRNGSSVPLATGMSDADGTFAFQLPAGTYTLIAGGATSLPRCAAVTVQVREASFATTTIECDTGIR